MSKPLGRLLGPLAGACAALALSLSVVQPAWAAGAPDQPPPSTSSSSLFGGPLAVVWCASPLSVQSGGTFTVGIWSLDASQALSSVAFTLTQNPSSTGGQGGDQNTPVQGRSNRSQGTQTRSARSSGDPSGNQNNGNQNSNGHSGGTANDGGGNQNNGSQNDGGPHGGPSGGGQNQSGTSLALTTDSLAQGAPSCVNGEADLNARSEYGSGQWWTATVSVPEVQSAVSGSLVATVTAAGSSNLAFSLVHMDVQPGAPVNQLPEAPYAAVFPATLLVAFGVSRRRRRRGDAA